MNKIRLGVIFGGKSSEYGVSLHSAGSLLRQIDDAKYTIIMIGITKEGDWYLYEGDNDALEHDHWQQAGCTPVSYTHLDVYKRQRSSHPLICGHCASGTDPGVDSTGPSIEEREKGGGQMNGKTRQMLWGAASLLIMGILFYLSADPADASVSYTHLDVYKRQASACSVPRWMAFPKC